MGIGGSGMCGIAEVLHNLGYAVTGSDLARSETVRRLEGLGVRVTGGHAAENVAQADVVVTSSAVAADNPEVAAARDRGIPVIPRAEMLAELMRTKQAVLVAGSHGKTTTTSMIGQMLAGTELDPTVVIGGRLSIYGSNAKLGKGEVMVAESDESDGSFLMLSPTIAVVTNIDREHLNFYPTGFEGLKEAFVTFMNKVPFYGVVVACADDPVLWQLQDGVHRRKRWYGFRPEAEVRGEIADREAGAWGCRVLVDGRRFGDLRLAVPGRHNLENALAAVAVGVELELSAAQILDGLAAFRGADRRFQILGEADGVLFVDDYAHHPTEIRATLRAARESYDRRLVAVFQPHRYSRVQEVGHEFPAAFTDADLIVVTEIYGAGETPLPHVTGADLAETFRQELDHTPIRFAPTLEEVKRVLTEETAAGDLVITLGAGDVRTVGADLLAAARADTDARERAEETSSS